jgi:RNAse (barnase) inhibitor barstar
VEGKYVIDGAEFASLDGFYDHVGTALGLGHGWGRNLNAFNDVLAWPALGRGGRYDLVWRNSEISRALLGHDAMADWLEKQGRLCHPSSVANLVKMLEAAKRREGPTLFDTLVEIIRANTEYVRLALE